MSEQAPRRFPYWLTLSVLINLVLIGFLAGMFLRGPHRAEEGRGGPPHSIELSAAERAGVRQLMRESFDAGRDALQTRREAERALADTLSAEPFDEAAARAALDRLREADRTARDTVSDRMMDGMDTLSADQRALVAKLIAGNMERRRGRGERLEKWRERREERRREGETDGR